MKSRLLTAAITLAASFAVSMAAAQTYPSKTVRWVVPYPAGGGTDVVARTVAEPLGKGLGQTLLVDNKPGANGAIGVADLMGQPRDGYTIISVDNGMLVFNPALYKKLTYNPGRDLVPVTVLMRGSLFLLIGPGSDFKDAKDLIAKAKAQPGKYSYGSAGQGTPMHLLGESFKRAAGLDLAHVPYRGSAPAMQDAVAGQVPMVFADQAAASAFLKAGKLRPLAVADAKRHPAFPDVPTFAELGYKDVELGTYTGLAVATGTPPAVIDVLYKQAVVALKDPAVTKRFADLGVDIGGNTPQQFAEQIKRETAKWHKVIADLNITLD